MSAELFIVLSSLFVGIPLIIMVFVAHYREKQADEEDARQNQVLT